MNERRREPMPTEQAMRLSGLQGYTQQWSADILSRDGHPLGHARFHFDEGLSSLKSFLNQAKSYRLLITLKDSTLEVGLTEGDSFYHGKGSLVLNGELAARWRADNGQCSLHDMAGHLVMRCRRDNTRRRLRWAFGCGLGLKVARLYSRWGDLVVGRDYFLASSPSSLCHWRTPQVEADLLNAQDAALVEALPTREQLFFLFLTLRRLCGVCDVGNATSGLGKAMGCPDIPSACRAGRRLSCRPESLGRPLTPGQRLAVLWYTGMPILTLLALGLLAIGCSFGGQTLAGASYFALLLLAIQVIVVVMGESGGEDIRLPEAASPHHHDN